MLVLTSFSLPTDCAAEKPVVNFGIALRYQPIKMYERFQPLMDYLSSETPYRFELKISRDYNESLRLLAEGKTDIASLGGGAAMESMILYGAKPVVKPLNSEGNPTCRCVIVVLKRSRIYSLRDLKGKRIALGYYHSTTGNLLSRALLARKGVTKATLVNLPNHEAVIRAVLKGEFEAGAVSDTALDQLIHYGLRVIARSESISSAPLVARKGVDPVIVKSIIDALLKLEYSNPVHRKMMEGWDAEFKYGFTTASNADYSNLMRLYQTKSFGCGVGCHQ